MRSQTSKIDLRHKKAHKGTKQIHAFSRISNECETPADEPVASHEYIFDYFVPFCG